MANMNKTYMYRMSLLALNESFVWNKAKDFKKIKDNFDDKEYQSKDFLSFYFANSK